MAPEVTRSKRRKLTHKSETDSDLSAPSEASESSSEDGAESKPPESADTGLDRLSRAPQLPYGNQKVKPTISGTSSVLAIQLDQLLAETKAARGQCSSAKLSLEQICDLVRSTPETKEMSIVQVEDWCREHGNVAIPFSAPRPSSDSNLKFRFQAPSSVDQVSLMKRGMDVGQPQQTRIEVEMPPSTLQEKDYLNLRAFHKRAFYLACIAVQLTQTTGNEFDIQYSNDDELELLPILRLRVKKASRNAQESDCIISVGFPKNVFPSEKCSPIKNCVRPKDSIKDSEYQPTPFYNACLLSRTGSNPAERRLTERLTNSEALSNACCTGQIWLHRRGFSSDISCGGFGMREWAMMCTILCETGGHRNNPLFSDRYSHLQLFKAMLQTLAGKDMTDPWVLRASLTIPPSDHPVFYDGDLGFNVLYKMSPWSYQMLRREAQLSLTALNSKTEDNFDLVFSSALAEPILQYDEIFSVSLPNIATSDAVHPQSVVSKLYTVLKRGLDDRANLVVIDSGSVKPWSIYKARPTLNKDQDGIRIYLLANPETAPRLVDHGPSAEEQEAAADFRKFWGEKAELRRFKDGSISESLVWSANEPVTLQIIRHMLTRHFNQLPSATKYRSHKLDDMIISQSTDLAPSEAFKIINDHYQTLTSTLHQLEGLPLPIRSISPADPALRSSTTSMPLDASRSGPLDVLIQFDSSTRWPDSLPAIQHTKIAFLLKLSDLLSTSDSNLTTRVGLENTSSSISGHLNTSFLDIIYPPPAPSLAPICFRLHIHHDRELYLLQTTLTDKSLHGSVRDQLTSALATHKRHFLAAPSHTTAIRNLITKFLPLSSTIRLLKKWISSHLLSRLIPDEVLEIIAAHIFLHPYPWSTPGSATVAFFRCLHFLAKWDWVNEPLIADLSFGQDVLGVKDKEQLQTRFQAWRKKLDPAMNQVCWFVGTSLDETGVVWTQGAQPERVVAGRVRALAAACLDVVLEKGVNLSEEQVRGLFSPPMGEFDFQLGLKRDVVKGGSGESKRKGDEGFKNLQITESLSHDRIGFDAVELYLWDLEKAFRNTALFFYDADGGRVIAGLWRPGVLGRKEWRVRMGYSTRPVVEKEEAKEEGKIIGKFNREAVLAEMKMMGEGIVKSVSVKREET